MIRSLSPLQRKQLTPSPIDLSSLFTQYKELENLRRQVSESHSKYIKEIEKKIIQLEQKIQSVKTPMRGDRGLDGKDGRDINHTEVVKDVLKQVRQPEDGETPTIDYKKVARLASQLIEPPKPQKIDEKLIIEKILESLKEGKLKLNIKHIDGFKEGLEQTIAPIRNLAAGFRGGGDTVAAGSGVTITNTNGVKTISATGGGGFTALTATETPNGILQVFTFAAATAQPSYLVVDNVWMKAISKAGTVNWTWDAGATQATFQSGYAPIDDIFGIV